MIVTRLKTDRFNFFKLVQIHIDYQDKFVPAMA